MFCPNCGAELDDDSLFCGECGTAVDEPNGKIENDDKTEVIEGASSFGEGSKNDANDVINDSHAMASPPRDEPADTMADAVYVASGDRVGAAPSAAITPQASAIKPRGSKAVLVVAIVSVVVVVAVALVAFFMLRSQAPASYNVQFETDGGTVIAAQQVAKGGQVTSPSNPTKSGYEFAGWYFNPECTDKATFPLSVDKDMVLYAKWEEKAEETTSSSKDPGVSATVDSSSTRSSGSSGSSGSSSASSSSNAYIIPNSSDVRLSRSDLESLSDDELAIARNEIWARHGRMFKNNWLQSYFNSQSWYKGTIPADDFLNRYTPTSIEEDNAQLMSTMLTERGYDVNTRHPN